MRVLSIVAVLWVGFFLSVPGATLAQVDEEAALKLQIAQLHNQGHYSDAIPLAHRLLGIREAAFGPNHPDVAVSLNILAMLYHDQGRNADAEPLYERALAIREKALGLNHLDVAQSLNNLALCYDGQGRYAEAEPLYQRALAINEKALGADHPAVATSLNNLAALYEHQGRYPEAESLYKRSLTIREKAFGADHLDVALSLNNLALHFLKQGRYADAEPLIKRSLSIRETTLGPDHPDVAQALNNLALVYYNQTKYADAELLFKRALAINEKALGPDHPDTAHALNNLATLYTSQERYAEAEPFYKNALAVKEKSLGRNHPSIALSLNNLASLYQRQNRYADALPVVQRTISENGAQKSVALEVLYGSQSGQLIAPTEALNASYTIVQRSISSTAGDAVSKLAARFGAGNTELAQLVRKDQDLAAEADGSDKSIIAAVSKPPAKRNAEGEAQIRKRIDEIKTEHDKLQEVFNRRFPDYVALSKPQPLSVQQTQALLADDEALVVFDFDAKSYAWVITRADADWIELKVASKDLDAQVKVLRQWLTSHDFKPFDAELSYKLYQATFGAIADKIGSKTRLSFITNGALTSLPPQVLITSDPTGKTLKDQDWLVRKYAITVLPTVASLHEPLTHAEQT